MELSQNELSPKDLTEFRNEYEGLPGKLDKWIDERPLVGAFFQGQARWQISILIKDDYYALVDGKIPVHPKGQVLKDTLASREKIDELLSGNEEQRKEYTRVDPATGETYQMAIEIEKSGAYVAEEIVNGEVQTQARIRTDGSTELTLSYKGNRYEDAANPNILSENLFPNASVKVFDLLVSTAN